MENILKDIEMILDLAQERGIGTKTVIADSNIKISDAAYTSIVESVLKYHTSNGTKDITNQMIDKLMDYYKKSPHPSATV